MKTMTRNVIATIIALASIIAYAQTKTALTPQRHQEQTLSQILYHFPTIWSGASDTLYTINQTFVTQWIPIGMSALSTPDDWETIARHMQRFVMNVTVDTIKPGAAGSYQLEGWFVMSHDTIGTIINSDSTNYFLGPSFYSTHPKRGDWVFPRASRQDSVTVAYPLRVLQPGYIRFYFKLTDVTNIKIVVRWQLVGVN